MEGSCVLLPGWTRWGADRETEGQAHLGSSGWQQEPQRLWWGFRKWVGVPGACADLSGVGQLGLPGTRGWGLTPRDPHTLRLLACCPEVELQGRDGTHPGQCVISWFWWGN